MISRVDVKKMEIKEPADKEARINIKLNKGLSGSKCEYQSNKCWKRFNNSIYYYIVKDAHVVILMKMDLSNGK